MLLAFLGGGAHQFHRFRQFPADFLLQDLPKSNVRCTQLPGVRNQWPAQAAATGIELAHPARNQIDQDVGIADFLQGPSWRR